VPNNGGIIKKLNFKGAKTVAIKLATPLMGTRIITMGFYSKEKTSADLFFAYLTSSLFLLDAIEKARSRCAEFVIIYLVDFNKKYLFPPLASIAAQTNLANKILSASEQYNGKIPLKDRPRLSEQIKQVRSDRNHPLRELDEAWFEALGMPPTLLDSMYREIEERLEDIVKKSSSH
jgi:hypothetical protein